MAVAKLDLRDIDWDLDGHLNAGGMVYTYESNTLNPLATFVDNTGATANPNPIVLDSSGQGRIWLTVGRAYKFVYTTAAGVTLYTENGITVAEPGGDAGSDAYDLTFYFLGGPPTAGQELFRHPFARDVNFAIDWAGSTGSVETLPTASFAATVQKNGVTVGAITTDASGVSSFTTTAGAAVSFSAADVLTVHAPEEVDATVTGIAGTFAGTLG